MPFKLFTFKNSSKATADFDLSESPTMENSDHKVRGGDFQEFESSPSFAIIEAGVFLIFLLTLLTSGFSRPTKQSKGSLATFNNIARQNSPNHTSGLILIRREK